MEQREACAVEGIVVLVGAEVAGGDAGFKDEVFIGFGDAATVVYDC